MNISSNALAGIFGLGPPELIIILIILLVLFGGSKLPSLARGLGQSIKEFKKSQKDGDEDKSAEKTADSSKKTSESGDNQKPGAN